jgi:hypothetical protein
MRGEKGAGMVARRFDADEAKNELERFFEQMRKDTAPAWRPEPGTTMMATVEGFRIGRDTGYGEYPIVIYKLDNGEVVSVHAFHTLLRDQLKELGTKKGVKQILHYGGKQKKTKATEEEVKAGRDEYHMYYVKNAADLGKQEDVTETFAF